jgi:hypothetical protein
MDLKSLIENKILEKLDEGIFKPHQLPMRKSFSKLKKEKENTPGEYKLIGKGNDFEVYASYGGSLKRQAHVIVRDDMIIGSGWTMPSALKDAKLKKTDVKHFSKFVDGSILNTMKESASRYGVDTGPLMKANAWIKRQKLSKMVQEEDLAGEKLAVGYIVKDMWDRNAKQQPIAVLGVDANTIKGYFKKGLNEPHSFYYDTGRGHRQTTEMITLTGFVEIDEDGEVTTKGKVDMNASTTLMVFK